MKIRLLISVLVVSAVLILWSRSGDELGESYYASEHYTRRVREFISKGYLRAACEADRTTIKADQQKMSDFDKEWFRASNLHRDIDNFNSNPDTYGWTFNIDVDCNLQGIHPSVHSIELPFAHRNRWQGSIFYSGASGGVALRSA
jgi:hypothetical protein